MHFALQSRTSSMPASQAMRLRIEHLRCACACLVMTACNTYDPELIDAPRKSNADTSPDTRAQNACAAHRELCNGEDDDCDGIIDEEAAHDCDLAHAVARCSAGTCAVESCAEGFSNCNGSAADGCERAATEIECGECDRPCAAAAPLDAGRAQIAEQTPDQPPAVEAEPDAGEETGTHDCVAQAERCDAKDNDCDGKIDEAASCTCLDSRPTGQGEACDRCACEQCPNEIAACLGNSDQLWVMRCSALLQCYGRNSSNQGCAAGDCFQNGSGPCAGEIQSAWLWNGISCATAHVTTPCGAAAALRDACLKSTCSAVCRF